MKGKPWALSNRLLRCYLEAATLIRDCITFILGSLSSFTDRSSAIWQAGTPQNRYLVAGWDGEISAYCHTEYCT
jgi:hypothetical protein